MKAAVSLLAEIEGVQSACIWEARPGRAAPAARAGLEDRVMSAGQRVSAARDSHAGAALESGLHVIVDDWSAERRFAMPPALRTLGACEQPRGGDRRQGAALRRPRRPLRPTPNSFTPQDVHFVQAAANVLADAIARHAADQALRYRVLHDSLTGLPNRLSFVEALDDALQRAALRLPGRDPLPRPRPLQADQRQHRPPRRRRAAAGGGAAAARPPAPRRPRRPLRRRRVRDPGRPPRRRGRGGRDRRPGRRPPSPSPTRWAGSSTSSPPASASPSPARRRPSRSTPTC